MNTQAPTEVSSVRIRYSFAMVAPRLWETIATFLKPFFFRKSTASWKRSLASGYSGT